MNPVRIWFLLIVALAVVGCVRSQTLVTECVHRDSTDRVIYLEREYRDVDTTVYFMAFSDGGRVLRSSTRLSGDTLIEVFRCHELEPGLIPKLGEMQALFGGDEFAIQTSSDSMWIIIPDGSLKAMWDTALTLFQGERFLDLYRRSSQEYASMVYARELSNDFSAAKLREVWEYRTLHGRLLNRRIFAGNGRVSNRQDFSYRGDTLIGLSYFDIDTAPYAIDSISWVADTSAMKVVNRWLDSGERFEYAVLFRGDSSVFSSGGQTVVDHWVYDRKPWNVRLREAALREGPLCQSRMVRAGGSLLKSSDASTGNYSRSEHLWLPDGRLLETVVSRNGRFDRRITYSYP